MRRAVRSIYTVNNTTMQTESTVFLHSYADKIDDNTTETLDLPKNAVIVQGKGMIWQGELVWAPEYTPGTPLTTGAILHPSPAHEDEASRKTTTSKEDIWTIIPKKVPVKASAEAVRRIRGREGLLEKLYAIIQDEGHKTNIALLSIEVLPDWSHEYDEQTGIVIHAEMQGSVDDRFTLWDAISNRLESFEHKLSADERAFLTNNLSVAIHRSS